MGKERRDQNTTLTKHVVVDVVFVIVVVIVVVVVVVVFVVFQVTGKE